MVDKRLIQINENEIIGDISTIKWFKKNVPCVVISVFRSDIEFYKDNEFSDTVRNQILSNYNNSFKNYYLDNKITIYNINLQRHQEFMQWLDDENYDYIQQQGTWLENTTDGQINVNEISLIIPMINWKKSYTDEYTYDIFVNEFLRKSNEYHQDGVLVLKDDKVYFGNTKDKDNLSVDYDYSLDLMQEYQITLENGIDDLVYEYSDVDLNYILQYWDGNSSRLLKGDDNDIVYNYSSKNESIALHKINYNPIIVDNNNSFKISNIYIVDLVNYSVIDCTISKYGWIESVDGEFNCSIFDFEKKFPKKVIVIDHKILSIKDVARILVDFINRFGIDMSYLHHQDDFKKIQQLSKL